MIKKIATPDKLYMKQSKIQAMRTEMGTCYKSAGLTDVQIKAIHQHEEMVRAK